MHCTPSNGGHILLALDRGDYAALTLLGPIFMAALILIVILMPLTVQN